MKLAKSFKVGRHSVAVKAVDAYGNVGEPATFSFKVERIKPKARRHRNKHPS